MKEDDRDERPEQAPAPMLRVRPGNFFRAAVVGALATLAPVAGCYDSEPLYGVPADASDSDSDTADIADDGSDMPLPPYGAPDYGVEEYGAPLYGVP